MLVRQVREGICDGNNGYLLDTILIPQVQRRACLPEQPEIMVITFDFVANSFVCQTVSECR